MKSYQRDRSLPDPEREPTISVIRAGQILGMSRNAAYAAAKDGRFPTIAISPSRVVVLTSEFLDKYRLGRTTRPPADDRHSPATHRELPGSRVHAQWQLERGSPGRLLLSATSWPQLRQDQREMVARAASDAVEAAIGAALGSPGIAS